VAGKRHRLVSTRKAAGFSQERLADVVDHEPEEAVRLATHALDGVDGSMVAPIVVRARRLRARIERWPELSAVRELDARLPELPGG
jgi:hypothetical protein